MTKQKTPVITDINRLDSICPIGITVCNPSDVIGGNNELKSLRSMKKSKTPNTNESKKEIMK